MEGVGEGVTHVQRAGNVRGRNRNNEGALRLDLAIGTPFGLEQVSLLPPLETTFFNNLGVIGVGGLLLLNLVGLLVSLGGSRLGSSSLSLLLSELLRLLSLLAFALD